MVWAKRWGGLVCVVEKCREKRLKGVLVCDVFGNVDTYDKREKEREKERKTGMRRRGHVVWHITCFLGGCGSNVRVSCVFEVAEVLGLPVAWFHECAGSSYEVGEGFNAFWRAEDVGD